MGATSLEAVDAVAKSRGASIEALTDGVSGITSGLPYFACRGTLDAAKQITIESDAARNAGVAVPIEGGKPVLEKAQPLPAVLAGDVLVVGAGTTVKKTDAPFTLHLAALDPGSSGSSGGSSRADSGGCVVAARALAGLLLLRKRR